MQTRRPSKTKPAHTPDTTRLLETLESRTLLTYAAPVSYNIGNTSDGFVPNAAPINVISADFNRDGKLDLIVSHKTDNSVYFLKGNGDGTFLPAIQIPLNESIEGREFVGDFNNDGKLDLFLPGGNSQAIILLGKGDGTFNPRIDSSSFAVSGYYPRGWTTGDFNNDGKLDVASTLPSNSADAGRYIVLLGNGDGTFQPGIVGPVGILHYSRWASTGDFNHDGKLDLAIADGQGTSGATATVELTILLGNGDGTFQLGGHYASPQLPDGDNAAATANPEDTVVADVNGDSKLDVIESDYDNTINLFLGNGDGTFQPARSIAPGNYPRDVLPIDVNLDNKIDLVVTNVGINQGGALFATNGAEPGSVSLLLGNGDGTFQDPITYSPSVYPGWTAAGDFNADGYPDLATTQVLNGHTVKVMLYQPANTNLPPTFDQSPSAAPNPATAFTTNLGALGQDDGGEPNLTYTWSTVGSIPAAVSFSINGTNAAKNTVATFTKTGSYLFQCAATDAAGLSIIDLVTVIVPPMVASIVRANNSPTNAASVNFTVTFTAPVTGVDPADFALAHTGLTSTSITSVTGSGATYNVLVNTGTGSGTLGLNLVDNDSIKDANTIPLGGTGSNNANFAGPLYTLDRDPPVINITSPTNGTFAPATTPLAITGTAGIAPGDLPTVTVKIYAGSTPTGTPVQTLTTTANPSTGAYTVNPASLAPGTYTLQSTQSDSAGNTGASPAITLHVPIPGDINEDNIVDGADFDIWFRNLNAHTSDWTRGDLNNDGTVDGADFDIWFTHLGQSLANQSTATLQSTQLPAPSPHHTPHAPPPHKIQFEQKIHLQPPTP